MMGRYWKIVLAVAVIAAITAFSHWRWQAGFNEAEGKWQQRWSQRDADDATALAKRQTETRNEEQRRQNEINEIQDRAAQRLAVVQADASTARAAADRLHNSAEILARRLADRERTCGAGTPGRSEAETSGAVLLAELFRRADARAGELAAAADEARTRGLACENAYNALKNR
ncbi:DUF2514 domain-containing protein (plasmid) [Erwinia tracheiphila]|uniref:DUF2514 family protein n=1 Tax=Erwinia tracheiphila TaxID=65700 RepID=UPI001F1E20A3|nr:DUF2514 family protein [Erwinia tracheiphila]UIA86022.1 DUF2514 domain-containing protein [Erwinia tracheiphila]